MKITFTLILFVLINFVCLAQNPTAAFGKIDIADLQLKECPFEKDANAMVLIDKGNIYFDQNFHMVIECHKRIKIFNEKGIAEAKIRLEYVSGNRREYIDGLQAETINLTDGKPDITKIEKKLIYTENTDKFYSATVFAFPNVKPGSVIEFKYQLHSLSYNMPTWFFQSNIPVRNSELTTEIPDFLVYKPQIRINVPYSKNTNSSESKSIGGGGTQSFQYTVDIQCRALSNIPSLQNEPYMGSRIENLQSMSFQLSSFRPIGGFVNNFAETWQKVCENFIDDEDFGSQLRKKLTGEGVIISKAKSIKNTDDRIAYIFNEVKNRMKWNDINRWYTIDGTPKAWDSKTGNSTEINIILYHLLKQSGIDVYPMAVSTRDHGRVNPAYPFVRQFNSTVAYIPVDSAKNYILDASDKYNVYNETPSELLNSFGFSINKENKSYDLVFIKKDQPARQVIMVNAEIKPDGKMDGSTEISSLSYFKTKSVKLYKKDGEESYKNHLKNDDNNLTISSLKLENMDVDSLPLTQKIDFKLSLTGSDGDYIYFNPNLFSSLRSNPFLNENRATDIDFGYRPNYSINGVYKVPTGFKADALPKNITLVMPDQSISFRRIIGEADGVIQVNYSIKYNKIIFFKEDYLQLHEFYKKMHEMLNEQIVLKKS